MCYQVKFEPDKPHSLCRGCNGRETNISLTFVWGYNCYGHGQAR